MLDLVAFVGEIMEASDTIFLWVAGIGIVALLLVRYIVGRIIKKNKK